MENCSTTVQLTICCLVESWILLWSKVESNRGKKSNANDKCEIESEDIIFCQTINLRNAVVYRIRMPYCVTSYNSGCSVFIPHSPKPPDHKNIVFTNVIFQVWFWWSIIPPPLQCFVWGNYPSSNLSNCCIFWSLQLVNRCRIVDKV